MWYFTGRDGKPRTRFHQAQRERQGWRCGARYPHHEVGLAIERFHIHRSYTLSLSIRINVLQLIEEAVEGSWIGHRARTFTRQQESEIGSLYAPPRQDGSTKQLVEVVIEIGDREEVSKNGAPLPCALDPLLGAYGLIR